MEYFSIGTSKYWSGAYLTDIIDETNEDKPQANLYLLDKTIAVHCLTEDAFARGILSFGYLDDTGLIVAITMSESGLSGGYQLVLINPEKLAFTELTDGQIFEDSTWYDQEVIDGIYRFNNKLFIFN